MEHDLASSGLVQLENAAAGGGLSASALAHQPQGLTFSDEKADIIHSLDVGHCSLEEDAGGYREVHLQVLDFKQEVLLGPIPVLLKLGHQLLSLGCWGQLLGYVAG